MPPTPVAKTSSEKHRLRPSDLPDDGKMEFNPAIKQGRVFLAIVTVYGRTDQFPRPVKAGIKTVE
jgi:hypothetical protein